MNQNVFGIILFSLIVGTAIFASEYFVTLPTPLPVYEKPFTVTNSGNSCGKRVYQAAKYGKTDLKIKQAVFNLRTKQLDTSLEIQRFDSETQNTGVTFHFYVKDGITTRYLASDTVHLKPNFDQNNKAIQEITSSYFWLDNLKSHKNLYVIAEPSQNSFKTDAESIPRFNESGASSVLLIRGI